MPSVTDSWQQIHAWLSQHADKIVGNLNPPATDAEILAAERIFGFEMPSDWRELYRAHNGMNSAENLGSLFYGMEFLSLERAVSEFRKNSVPAESTLEVRAGDVAIQKADIYNAKWIALGHDGGDTLIRVDMDPAPTGELGQVIFTDHADDTAILLHRSVAALMSDFVRDLQAGRYFLHKDALATGGHFLDCEREIDVVNWHLSPRWKHFQ